MIALLFSFILDYRVPVNYYWEEPKKIAINLPVNRSSKRRSNRDHTGKRFI